MRPCGSLGFPAGRQLSEPWDLSLSARRHSCPAPSSSHQDVPLRPLCCPQLCKRSAQPLSGRVLSGLGSAGPEGEPEGCRPHLGERAPRVLMPAPATCRPHLSAPSSAGAVLLPSAAVSPPPCGSEKQPWVSSLPQQPRTATFLSGIYFIVTCLALWRSSEQTNKGH